MDCKVFQNELPDLVLTPGARPSLAAVAHMKSCPPCAQEYLSFQGTFAALDAWKAPQPSLYFDQSLAVLIREEQAQPRMSFFERMQARFLFNTGRNFRPAMAGALALALIAAGGGSFIGIHGIHSTSAPQASATVKDLQILDRNEQAFQTMDELQQDDDTQPTPQTNNDANQGPTT